MVNPRSLLYVPAHRPRMLAGMASLAADGFVVDLEDGVPPSGKPAARDGVREALDRGHLPRGRWALRVNASGSSEFAADVQLAAETRPAAVVLPKAEDPAIVERCARDWSAHGAATLLMIETARGVGRVRELAAAVPSVEALIYGSADLRLELGARPDADRTWERHAMSEIVLAARMAGCAAIDAVTFKFRDVAALDRDARIARTLGFDGKSCIHPSQIEKIHEVFSSTSEEIDWAERVQVVWREQHGDRSGVVVLDGEMIEALHLEVAERILLRRP